MLMMINEGLPKEDSWVHFPRWKAARVEIRCTSRELDDLHITCVTAVQDKMPPILTPSHAGGRVGMVVIEQDQEGKVKRAARQRR